MPRSFLGVRAFSCSVSDCSHHSTVGATSCSTLICFNLCTLISLFEHLSCVFLSFRASLLHHCLSSFCLSSRNLVVIFIPQYTRCGEIQLIVLSAHSFFSVLFFPHANPPFIHSHLFRSHVSPVSFCSCSLSLSEFSASLCLLLFPCVSMRS